MTILLLAPVALKAAVTDLVAEFGRISGVPVETDIVLNPEVPRRIAKGEAFDVAITNPGYVADLVDAGYADSGSHRAFGRVPLAIAIAGETGDASRRPEDVADLLLSAESIAYTGAGTSGRIFREMAEGLGVLDRIEARLRPMDAGAPIRAVAEGRAVLAAAPLTVVRTTPGVRAAAICPPEMGTDIEMSIFLSPDAAHRADARALLSFLTDARHDASLSGAGVERFTLPAWGLCAPASAQW
jgi:ABC-type molybdate transport system substrate-binding protein